MKRTDKIIMAMGIITACIFIYASANAQPGEPRIYESTIEGWPSIVIDAEESHAPGCVLGTTNLDTASIFYRYLMGNMNAKQFVDRMSKSLVRAGIFTPLKAREFALKGVDVCQRPPV